MIQATTNIHAYTLECLICGAMPTEVPDIHGSELNNLQAHMMSAHAFTWEDWQVPGGTLKTETRRADGALVYVWTRTSDDLPFMRAVQTAVDAAPSRDALYLDV